MERQLLLKRQFQDEYVEDYTQCSNLFVKNLEETVDDALLRNAFSKFGKITSAKVMRNENGQSKGFGFVAFSKNKEAEEAVHAMNHHVLISKPLYMTLTIKKDECTAETAATMMSKGQQHLQDQQYTRGQQYPQPGRLYPHGMCFQCQLVRAPCNRQLQRHKQPWPSGGPPQTQRLPHLSQRLPPLCQLLPPLCQRLPPLCQGEVTGDEQETGQKACQGTCVIAGVVTKVAQANPAYKKFGNDYHTQKIAHMLVMCECTASLLTLGYYALFARASKTLPSPSNRGCLLRHDLC